MGLQLPSAANSARLLDIKTEVRVWHYINVDAMINMLVNLVHSMQKILSDYSLNQNLVVTIKHFVMNCTTLTDQEVFYNEKGYSPCLSG